MKIKNNIEELLKDQFKNYHPINAIDEVNSWSKKDLVEFFKKTGVSFNENKDIMIWTLRDLLKLQYEFSSTSTNPYLVLFTEK